MLGSHHIACYLIRCASSRHDHLLFAYMILGPVCFKVAFLHTLSIMRKGRLPAGRDHPDDRLDRLERLVEGLVRELRQTRPQDTSTTSSQAEQTNGRRAVPPPPPPMPQVPP